MVQNLLVLALQGNIVFKVMVKESCIRLKSFKLTCMAKPCWKKGRASIGFSLDAVVFGTSVRA